MAVATTHIKRNEKDFCSLITNSLLFFFYSYQFFFFSRSVLLFYAVLFRCSFLSLFLCCIVCLFEGNVRSARSQVVLVRFIGKVDFNVLSLEFSLVDFNVGLDELLLVELELQIEDRNSLLRKLLLFEQNKQSIRISFLFHLFLFFSLP